MRERLLIEAGDGFRIEEKDGSLGGRVKSASQRIRLSALIHSRTYLKSSGVWEFSHRDHFSPATHEAGSVLGIFLKDRLWLWADKEGGGKGVTEHRLRPDGRASLSLPGRIPRGRVKNMVVADAVFFKI